MLVPCSKELLSLITYPVKAHRSICAIVRWKAHLLSLIFPTLLSHTLFRLFTQLPNEKKKKKQKISSCRWFRVDCDIATRAIKLTLSTATSVTSSSDKFIAGTGLIKPAMEITTSVRDSLYIHQMLRNAGHKPQ